MHNNYQRLGAISNAHVGRDFTEKVKIFFALEGYDLEKEVPVEIGFQTRKMHRFDLGCKNQKILVECKCFTWTGGGNSPSAKIKDLNVVMLYFATVPSEYRRIVVMRRDVRKTESLAEYYLRLNKHLFPGEVELWEYDEDSDVCLRLN